jgi:opacity protein-like surface antigen
MEGARMSAISIAVRSELARAQVSSGSQDVQIYAGEMFGDRLTDTPLSNMGLGAKYYLRDNVFIDFDTRYRYLRKLVSDHGQGLNTSETTLSIGYQF